MVQLQYSSCFSKGPYKITDEEEEEYKIYPEWEYHRDPYTRPRSRDCSRYGRAESPARLRHVDVRLAQNYGCPRRIKQLDTVCRSEFPQGILPRRILDINREKFARREAMNYSTTQRRLQCSNVNYLMPLKIFGQPARILPRAIIKKKPEWDTRVQCERAQSAPPYPRPGDARSEYSSSQTTLPDCCLTPNYECECFIEEESEEIQADEDAEKLGLQQYILSVSELSGTAGSVSSHFKTFQPTRHISSHEIEQLHALIQEDDELQQLALLVMLERLSTRSELCDTLTEEFLIPVLRTWLQQIQADECVSQILDAVIAFIQKITATSRSELWLDAVFKHEIIEKTTSRLTHDGTRSHYCTLMLRVLSDARCCATMLATTALPECISLPQVKQDYWEGREQVFLDEDIFLQEEILKIFCNIAHSSSYGRKVLICQGVIDTIARILAYANCPVQYQAAMLVGALCEDDTGCSHVTSELTNQRADQATCMKHLGNLFLYSKCMRVKAAAGSAMARLFSTSDRGIAIRGLRAVHSALHQTNTPFKRPVRPKTAPSKMQTTVNQDIVKDVLCKYAEMCTSNGPFSHSNFFKCRLMALDAVKALFYFPVKRDGRQPLNLELGNIFFAVQGEHIFKDLRQIAEKHRSVKMLQDQIQKIQLSLIYKTKRNERLSELMDVELQDIKEDNSVIRIPQRDFELAKNELVYCEVVIKSLSMLLAGAMNSSRYGDMAHSIKRNTSQYTTLQDSLYNKYAMNLHDNDKANLHDNQKPDDVHLTLVRQLLSHQLVETLTPWMHCVYPPITQSVVRCLSSLFTYSSLHNLTVRCVEAPDLELSYIQPSDVSSYFRSKPVTPQHISCQERSTHLTDSATRSRSRSRSRSRRTSTVISHRTMGEMEQCTHHIGHLCSRLLTQNLLVCNNSTVSHLAAELLRDITRAVPREQLICMVDDKLLEKLTEYIILCNGDESSIFVALDILQTLFVYQPTLGKLYNTVGGLDQLVAKLISATTPALKHRVLEIINMLPSDERWCQLNKVDCPADCQHLDVWHKVTSKWETQDNASRLLSVE